VDDFLKALRDATSGGRPSESPLANLLGGILGGETGEKDGATDSVSGVAEQAGITPDIAQAVMALVAGQLASRQAGGADKTKSAGLDELLEQVRGGQAVDETALKASGLPQNLAKSTGLDLSEAIRVMQKLLPSLAALLGLPGSKPVHKPKPKPKPRPAAKPKPASKPKPSAASRPKPSTSTSKPAAKPKPKPSSSSRPKPSTSAAKPRRRKSDGGDPGGSDIGGLLEHA
jgi:hypothetical protein